MRHLKNCFTFGFEVEGAFDSSLSNELSHKMRKKKGLKDIVFKEDPSVSLSDYEYEKLDNPDYDEQECAIGIFDSLNETIEYLSMFKNGTNYVENSTCGLHVHIKPKEGYEKLRETISDYGFIKTCQDWASENLCPHVANRVKDRNGAGYFCQSYHEDDKEMEIGTLRQVKQNWDYGNKYQFIRNHTQGTYEFRFFAPCDHKVENVKLFFEFFFKLLKKQKPTKKIWVELSTKVETLPEYQSMGSERLRATRTIRYSYTNSN